MLGVCQVSLFFKMKFSASTKRIKILEVSRICDDRYAMHTTLLHLNRFQVFLTRAKAVSTADPSPICYDVNSAALGHEQYILFVVHFMPQ